MGMTAEVIAQLLMWGYWVVGILGAGMIALVAWWGGFVFIDPRRLEAVTARKARALEHKERLKELEVEAKRIDLEGRRLDTAERHNLVHMLEYKSEDV
jgi:hypothetical protein